MIDKMSNYILDNVLYKNEKIEGDQREIMLFGVTRILEDIPKYAIIFLIGYFFHILQYMGIVLAVTALYKTFVGGVHARTNLICLFSSIAYFILPIILANYIPMGQTMLYILSAITYLFSLYVIIKIAPADTEEVPILKKARRKKLKIIAFISVTIVILFSLLELQNSYIQKIILFSLLEMNIMTTKPLYRLFSCKYSYESDEFKEYYNT